MPTKRSKLCEILGVDYDEEFEYCSNLYKVIINRYHQIETIRMFSVEADSPWISVSSYMLIDIINNADEIIHRKTFTSQEIVDAEVLHRVWNMDKIEREGCVPYMPYMVNADDNETILRFDAFPSIQNGESFTYEQIVNSNKENCNA